MGVFLINKPQRSQRKDEKRQNKRTKEKRKNKKTSVTLCAL
jgi:hypothetical protein